MSDDRETLEPAGTSGRETKAAPTSPRQTLRYLRNLLESRGLRAKNKLGQSFLIDLNILELLVRNAHLTRDDVVLEVGSGTGSLTARLASAAGRVFGVELDQGFYQLACENTAEFDNVTLICGDILANKNRLNPDVVKRLEQLLEETGGRLKLVSNLPYVVATPVITNALLSDLPFELMVVTIQWEVAERLVAVPGTKDFGSLTILVQSLADASIIRRIPPQAFWPRPKVDSAIVVIRPSPEKRRQIRDLAGFHRFIRNLYLHRRKNLRRALKAAIGRSIGKAELDAVLNQHGFDPLGRAEQLTVADHYRLWQAIST